MYCNVAIPCSRSINVNVPFLLYSEVDTQSVTAVVHATVEGVTVVFPLKEPDGCKTGVTCPVQTGSTNIYTNTLLIDSSYPNVLILFFLYFLFSLRHNVSGDFCDHSSFFALGPNSVQIYADVTQIDSSHNLFQNLDQPRAILEFICDEDFLAFS